MWTAKEVTQALVDTLKSTMSPESRARWEARQAELRWLRDSLEADLLPAWLIELVLEGWGQAADGQ